MTNWQQMLMAESIHCPECDASEPPVAAVGSIAVCKVCGTSLHVASDGAVERATARHLDLLTPHDLHALRTARARIVRPDRRLH